MINKVTLRSLLYYQSINVMSALLFIDSNLKFTTHDDTEV